VKLTLAAGLFVAASAAVFAQTPAGSSPQGTTPQQRPSATAQQNSPKQGEQTLTGCLTSAENIYTLTVMDDSGAPGTTATTTAYTLAPGSGVDLQGHVNKRVTVKGTEAGPDAQSSTRIVDSSPAKPAATGTSGTASANGATNPNARSNADANRSSAGGATPTVQTTAKARITSKTLNVTDVQAASGSCGAQ
jgi:hypothetical protein